MKEKIKERLWNILDEVIAGLVLMGISGLTALIGYYTHQGNLRVMLQNWQVKGGIAVSVMFLTFLVALFFVVKKAQSHLLSEKKRLNYDLLLAAARDHFAREAIAVHGKYLPALYVQRTAEKEFYSFLSSSEKCFLVIGEAGSGKTNLLLHVAEGLLSHSPVFFYRAIELPEERFAIEKAIAEDIALHTGIEVGISVLKEISKALPEDIHFIIFIDAINEHTNPSFFRESLGEMIERIRTYSDIKVVISCRTPDWSIFRADNRIVQNLYTPSFAYRSSVEGVLLTEFSVDELQKAWKKYRDWFRLQGEVSPELLEVSASPIMLRFIGEAYKGKILPHSIRVKEVFDKYWEAKISPRHGLSIALYRLTSYMRSKQTMYLSEEQVLGLIGREDYDALLSEGVILYTKKDRITGANIVGFTYEAFLEYVLASQILRTELWGKDSKVLISHVDQIIRESASYRPLVGAIEFIILHYEKSHYLLDLLGHMVTLAPKWRILACRSISKLNALPLEGFSLLKSLSMDNEYWVRWSAAYALSHVASRDVLEEWALDPAWQIREAAANALARVPSFPGIKALMRSLAKDHNWRVRRAIAYSVNYQIEHGYTSLDIIREWAEDPVWKVRYAAVIAQTGLATNPEESAQILSALSLDPEEQVRWSIAKVAPTLPQMYDRAIIILDKMSTDPSPWVRKRVATSIASLAARHQRLSLEILDRLSADDDFRVKVEVARSLSLAYFRINERVERILDKLGHDQRLEVRAAASFTVRILRGEVTLRFPDILDEINIGDLLTLREVVARVTDVLHPPDKRSSLYVNWRKESYVNYLITIKEIAKHFQDQKRKAEWLRLLAVDAEEGIRWAVTQVSLNLIKTNEAANLFRIMSYDDHWWIREALVERLPLLLKKCSKKKAVMDKVYEILSSLCQDSRPEVRIAVAKIVIDLLPEDRERLLSLVDILSSDADSEVRRACLFYRGS